MPQVRAGSGLDAALRRTEWIEIPAGEFGWEVAANYIKFGWTPIGSLVPITNAQYHLFAQATGHPAPEHWREDRPRSGSESHPVVNVSWHDALAHCRWLSERTGSPSPCRARPNGEKAARGDKDKREYPWATPEGDPLQQQRVRVRRYNAGGIFPEGAQSFWLAWIWPARSGNGRGLWARLGKTDFLPTPTIRPTGGEDLQAPDNVRRCCGRRVPRQCKARALCLPRPLRSPDFRFDDGGFRWWCPHWFALNDENLISGRSRAIRQHRGLRKAVLRVVPIRRLYTDKGFSTRIGGFRRWTLQP